VSFEKKYFKEASNSGRLNVPFLCGIFFSHSHFSFFNGLFGAITNFSPTFLSMRVRFKIYLNLRNLLFLSGTKKLPTEERIRSIMAKKNRLRERYTFTTYLSNQIHRGDEIHGLKYPHLLARSTVRQLKRTK
jgi:hypothetical protein